MIVASIEGSVIAVVVTLVVVLIRWLGDRNPVKPTNSPMRKDTDTGRGRTESEEERMRRFLEALGIPPDSAEAQRPASPPPLRKEAKRESKPGPRQIKPVPPIIEPERERIPNRPPGSRVPPLPKRSAPQRSPRKEVRPLSSDEAPAPHTPAGQIHVPELRTREVEHLETVSSKISAISEVGSDLGRLMTGASRETQPLEAETEELWREALRSPQALRSAFILKEILGTPRGLQSDAFTPSLPTL